MFSAPRHRTLLLADSHGRELTHILQDHFGSSMQATAMLKPGAGLQNITRDIQKLTQNFTKNDVVILIGGTNDELVNFNFTVIDHLINSTMHTNVLLASVPYRYDDRNRNYSIYQFNKRLMERIAPVDHIHYIDINYNMTRAEYTRHGLHFNNKGKILIGEIFNKKLSLLCGGGACKSRYPVEPPIESTASSPDERIFRN